MSLLNAEAHYVYLEGSTNAIAPDTLRFRDVMTLNRTKPLNIGTNIEFQFYWNPVRIYYATDGSIPLEAWEVGSSMASLPVNLLSFNARLAGRKVMLDWQTASETNSDFFDIERSKFGTSEWIFVSRMNGKGNSNYRIDYQAIDHKPYEGVNYYRLKMVDNDGKVSYSAIRKVINEAGVISIYPNPAQGYVLVSGLNKNKLNMLHLLDVSGKLFQEHFVRESQFRFDLSNLTPGVYYLSINGELHYQFVKNK